jgi:hypothetical protein
MSKVPKKQKEISSRGEDKDVKLLSLHPSCKRRAANDDEDERTKI